MGTLGQALQAAREEHGLTLADLEAASHIRKQYLIAIESDRVADLPAPVYARAYVRTIAKCVGLEPETMVALYDQARPQREIVGVQPEVRPPRMPSAITGRTLVAILVAAILVVGGYYLYNTYLSLMAFGEGEINVSLPQAPSSRTTPVPAFAAPLPPDVKPTPTAMPTVQPSPTATPIRGVHLLVRIKERSWLRVTVDEQVVYEGIPQVGSDLKWDGNSKIVLRTGNAGGIEITFNGKVEGTLGAPGEVKDVQWTAS